MIDVSLFSQFYTFENTINDERQSIFDFANDYAWTLEQWQKKFSQHKEQLISMNYPEAFLRAWDYYFSVSIASFKSGRTNVMQVELIN